MYYQVKFYEEEKLVRCIMGVIYDVIVDFCQEFFIFKQWVGVELNVENC